MRHEAGPLHRRHLYGSAIFFADKLVSLRAEQVRGEMRVLGTSPGWHHVKNRCLPCVCLSARSPPLPTADSRTGPDPCLLHVATSDCLLTTGRDLHAGGMLLQEPRVQRLVAFVHSWQPSQEFFAGPYNENLQDLALPSMLS